MAEPQQKITFRLPRNFTHSQRLEVGEEIIDNIIDRTDRGIDKFGDRFTKYSKSYKKSEVFKDEAKSNIVNLQLTGGMIDDLKVLGHGTGFITIGYKANTDSNDKAAWAAAVDNGASRKFIGLPKDVIDEIIDDIKGTTLESNATSLLASFFKGGTDDNI